MLNQDVWVVSPGNLLGSHNLCTLLDGTWVSGLVPDRDVCVMSREGRLGQCEDTVGAEWARG